VYPNERWALFLTEPMIQKVTGKLDDHIIGQSHRQSLETYIKKKHNLCTAQLDQIDLEGLETFLRSQRIHQRAHTIKLIHRWIPTQAFLHKQNRSTNATCERCKTHHEDSLHILQCPNEKAVTSHQNILYSSLDDLLKTITSIYILQALEENLTQFLAIPSMNKFNPSQIDHDINHHIRKVIQNENIIGWENFTHGYISNKWAKLQKLIAPTAKIS
jgi:hypothetical protein